MVDKVIIPLEIKETGRGLAQATDQAARLRDALKEAADMSAQVRVPLATGMARQGIAARAAAAQPGGGASDTNLSRGISGQTGASGRDFAAQAQGLGGLVHVYATFAANLYAVSAAYGALSKAADTANIIKGLEQLGAASGRSLGALAKQMVAASDGAISLRQAMTSTAMATAGGMSSDAILRMTEVAKKASLALGRDMTDSMDRLTKGIVKIQPELLDELGIMTRVIPAQQSYARELGKSADALSDFEKRQAFANAVLKEGESKFNNIDIQSNAYAKLTASLSNLATEGLNTINIVLLPIAKLLAESPVGLAFAVSTVAGILLKQAIPALGQYKKGLESIQKQNLEKAATKSDILIDTGMYDLGQAERSKQAFLDRNKYAEQSAEKQKQLLLEGEQVHAAVLAKNEARSKSFFGHETTNQMIINRAYSEAAASNIKSDVAQTQSRYGLVAAWKRLNEEINVSKTTGQLLKFGDGIEVVAPKTNALQNGFMRLSGAVLILGTAIGTIIEAFSGWLIVITAAVAAIKFFIDYSKTAGKESEKLAGSVDLLNDATKTVDKTLETINKKPFLEQLSRESLSAKANALGGVSDALIQVGKDAKAVEAKMGFWDRFSDARFWNVTKNLFKPGSLNLVDKSNLAAETSTALAQSIVDAAKLVEGGPAEAEFKASIARIIGVSYSSIDELETRLGSVGDKLINNKPAIIGAVEDTSKSVRTAAANGETLKTAWDAAAKSWDSIVASLATKDPLGKLGQESMEVGLQMSKAFGDTGEKLAELTSLTRDYQKLRMVSPETQRDLIQWGYSIEKAGKEIEALKTKLESQKKAAKEAADALTKAPAAVQASSVTARGPQNWQSAVANRETAVISSAKTLADSTAQQVKNTEKQIQLLKDSMQNDNLYLKAQTEVFVNGAKQFENSIGLGFQKSGIDVQLKALAGNTTAEGIKQSARLQEQAIGIQIKGIEANQQLVIATNNLARITEEVAIEEKAKEIRSPGFTGNRAAEQAKLDIRSNLLAALKFADTMSTQQLKLGVMGGPTTLNGKPAQAKPVDDPILLQGMAKALTERNLVEAGNLEISILGNTKLANRLQEQKDLAVSAEEAKRAGLESTLAEANAQQSVLSSLEKYAPIITDIAIQKKLSLDTTIRETQQELTRLGLVAKLKAEQAALAKMNANPTLYAKGTRDAQKAAVNQAQANLNAQESKNIADNTAAAQAAAEYKLSTAKKNFDFEAGVRKQQDEWNNEDLQNTINLSSIKLGTLSSMKALQESVLSDQQRQLEFDKEDADYASKLASAREANLAKEFDLRQRISQFGTGTKEYADLNTQLEAETAHYKKQKIALEQLHNAKNKQIGDMAAYNKALAEINEAEERAARIRQSAEAQTTIAQLNLTTLSNTKAFLDDEIIARQRIVDLDKEQNSYTAARAAIEKKYAEQLAGVNTALESKPADKDLLARKQELSTALKKEQKDLIDVKIATEANINATSRYNKAMAELTQTQALVQSKRAVRAGILSNKESLGTVSVGTAAISRADEAVQAANEQFAKDTLGAQQAINELSAIDINNRTVKQNLDLAAATASKQHYQDLLTDQTTRIENDADTAIQLAINNGLLEKQNLLTSTATSLTQNLTTVFADLGAAIGSVSEILAKMLNDQVTSSKVMADLRDQEVEASKELMKTDDPKKQIKLAEDLARIQASIAAKEKQSAAQQLANGSLLAGQTKKLFEQKTVGYKVLGALEKVAAAAAAASNVVAMVQTAKELAITIPGVYAKFMEQFGWPGIGMAAGALAALGISSADVPGGGGSKVDMTGKTSAERQKTQGTGGVFGDSEAKTTTIVNSLELLAKNSIEGLNYDNELLKAMRRVADSVSGAAKSIYASPGIRTGQGFGTAEKTINEMGSFGNIPVVGKVLDSIFGGGTSTSTKITSAGIQLKGTFKEVMNDVSGSIQQFKDVLTTSHTDGGWFGQDSDSSSLAHQVQNLGSNTSQAIADIFGQANQMFAILGNKTNVSAASINKTLETFDVSMPIDLMNKTGQELVDELNAVIGERISNAAQKIFTGFEKYREFGEDYLATVLRVVDGNDKVNQSLLSIGHAFSIVGKFDISEDMIKIAGGLEAFQNETAFFRDNFLTAAEKLEPVQKSVNDQLTKLGINIGITRDDFKKLVISQNLSTQSGREMYQSLLELAPGFDTVTKALDELATKSLDLEAKIYELIGQKSTALTIARNKELAAMDASLRPRQVYINALTDEIAIRDRLKAAYDSSNKSVNAAIVSLNNYKTALLAGAASTLTPAQKYADAAAIFKATAQAAAVKITTASTAADIATRDEAVAKLNSVSDSFLANSKEMNAGTQQYQDDLTAVTNAVDAATLAMGTQLSDAKLQLGFLDTIAAATQTTADILTEYLTAQGVTNVAQTGAVTSGSVAATFQIPGHAAGGLAQGISIVGENGPELVDFKNPGRVYSNQASNDIFSTKELVEEIKALRKEVADLRADQKEQTGHLITSTYDANNRNAEAIVTANQEALNNQNWSTRSKVKVA